MKKIMKGHWQVPYHYHAADRLVVKNSPQTSGSDRHSLINIFPINSINKKENIFQIIKLSFLTFKYQRRKFRQSAITK